jgi:hypothetical protein
MGTGDGGASGRIGDGDGGLGASPPPGKSPEDGGPVPVPGQIGDGAGVSAPCSSRPGRPDRRSLSGKYRECCDPGEYASAVSSGGLSVGNVISEATPGGLLINAAPCVACAG